jgi:hypothetical protein
MERPSQSKDDGHANGAGDRAYSIYEKTKGITSEDDFFSQR